MSKKNKDVISTVDSLNRRKFIFTSGSALVSFTLFGGNAFSALPKLKKKSKYKVGFAQTESNNPWRLAQTKSMKDTAAEYGWDLVYTDAAGSAAKQVSDVRSMIAQRVDVILLAPREEKPLAVAVKEAKRANIPVFLIDRNVDQKLAKAGEDYVAFVGSDFVKEGRICGEVCAKVMNGNAKIIELQGTTGSSPAIDRGKGFAEAISSFPNMNIVASQSGDFARDKGRQVMETLLQAHPNVNIVYAHNDEMAIGAIQALELAGRQPGKDVLVVSIDGTRDALQAIIDGKMGVTVESSPFFGPLACDVMKRYAAGETIETWVQVQDRIFTAENAADHVDEAY